MRSRVKTIRDYVSSISVDGRLRRHDAAGGVLRRHRRLRSVRHAGVPRRSGGYLGCRIEQSLRAESQKTMAPHRSGAIVIPHLAAAMRPRVITGRLAWRSPCTCRKGRRVAASAVVPDVQVIIPARLEHRIAGSRPADIVVHTGIRVVRIAVREEVLWLREVARPVRQHRVAHLRSAAHLAPAQTCPSTRAPLRSAS